jgi:hypothetical protein
LLKAADGREMYAEKKFRLYQEGAWRNEVMNLYRLRCYKLFCKEDEMKNDSEVVKCALEQGFCLSEVDYPQFSEYFPVPPVVAASGCNLVVLEKYVGRPLCDKEGLSEFDCAIGKNQVSSSSSSSSFSSSAAPAPAPTTAPAPAPAHVPAHTSSSSPISVASLFTGLFDLLALFARCGIVHRDIREANVTILDNKLYLLDYAFCCPAGVEAAFAGGIKCASDFVLNSLRNSHSFKMSNGDDIYSLIRLMTLMQNQDLRTKLDNLRKSPSYAVEIWNKWNQFEYIPDFESLKTMIYSGDVDNSDYNCKLKSELGAKIMRRLIREFPYYFNITAVSKNNLGKLGDSNMYGIFYPLIGGFINDIGSRSKIMVNSLIFELHKTSKRSPDYLKKLSQIIVKTNIDNNDIEALKELMNKIEKKI